VTSLTEPIPCFFPFDTAWTIRKIQVFTGKQADIIVFTASVKLREVRKLARTALFSDNPQTLAYAATLLLNQGSILAVINHFVKKFRDIPIIAFISIGDMLNEVHSLEMFFLANPQSLSHPL